jgi:hypothetical protein
MKAFFVILVIVLLLGAAVFVVSALCEDDWCYLFPWQTSHYQRNPVAASFEECVALGNPVMESYPRQCRANGQTFVEKVIEQPFVSEKVKVSSPLPQSLVKSPLTITGEARGIWYFEASFPVEILDANGKRLGQHYAEAQGEWMTTEFVPFTSTLMFEMPTTDTGFLVLHKDNPSGLPEHDESIRFPIRFK